MLKLFTGSIQYNDNKSLYDILISSDVNLGKVRQLKV